MPGTSPDLWILLLCGCLLLALPWLLARAGQMCSRALQRGVRRPTLANSPPSTACGSTDSQSSMSR